MKRVLLTAALCVAVSASFAQKKVVKQAQGLVKGTSVEASAYDEARTLIWQVSSKTSSSAMKEQSRCWARPLMNRRCTQL